MDGGLFVQNGNISQDSQDYVTFMTLMNSTEEVTTMEAILVPPRFKPWMMTLRYTCEVKVTLPIAVLGILGNLLTILVLFQHKNKSTTQVFLQYLALTDTLVLLSIILIRTFRYLIPGYAGGNAYMYMYRYMNPCVYIIRMMNTWLTVVLTIDRFIAVCHPLHAQRLCTIRRTYFLMALLLLVSTLFCMPRFFEYEIDGRHLNKTQMMLDKHYTVGYRIVLFFVVMYLTPMLLLTVLNTRLLTALRKASTHRNSLHQAASFTTVPPPQTPQGRTPNGLLHSGRLSNNRSITVIVITVVLVSIVCNVTAMIAHALWSLTTSFDHLWHLDTTRRVLSNISNVLLTLNSAINFVIYCLCSCNFRAMCMHFFRLDRLRERMTRSQSGTVPRTITTMRSNGTSYISLFTFNTTKNNYDGVGKNI